jgi:hypothetical protein
MDSNSLSVVILAILAGPMVLFNKSSGVVVKVSLRGRKFDGGAGIKGPINWGGRCRKGTSSKFKVGQKQSLSRIPLDGPAPSK